MESARSKVADGVGHYRGVKYKRNPPRILSSLRLKGEYSEARTGPIKFEWRLLACRMLKVLFTPTEAAAGSLAREIVAPAIAALARNLRREIVSCALNLFIRC